MELMEYVDDNEVLIGMSGNGFGSLGQVFRLSAI
jgi:hypothetical protein